MENLNQNYCEMNKLARNISGMCLRPAMYAGKDATVGELYNFLVGVTTGYSLGIDDMTIDSEITDILRKSYSECNGSLDDFCSSVRKRLFEEYSTK